MNIDLLLTSKGEAGLVCDEPLPEPVIAVLFDLPERLLYIEMEDQVGMELNIAVGEEHLENLACLERMEFGVFRGDEITESFQVPVIVLEDEASLASLENLPYRMNSVLHFESFIRNASIGQPVHREDLGNETTLNSLMDATQLVAPQFSPKLAHQKKLEAAPRTPAMGHAPQFAGPGGGGTGGGSPNVYRRTPSAHQRNEKGEKD